MTEKPELPSFNIGDVVQSKIGGPRMTVEKVDTYIRCVWFDNSNVLQRDAFDAVALEIVAP